MTILYIFLAIIVGWFIGFLDSNLRTSKKLEAADARMKEAEKKIAEAEQHLQPPPMDDPGLLRLKKNAGRYTLEVDGTLVPREISPDRKQRLIELVTVLRPWLDSGQSSPVVPQPVAPIQTPPMPDPAQGAFPRPVPVSVRNATPPAPVPVTLQSLVQPKKPEPEKNVASYSIVQQIDMVLQERLLNSPLVGRGIRLQESIQGGVEVYVGLQKFHAVDDVPDEEIKTTIRTAIAEWEKKYTPGL
jgi:hypothetical protein